MYKKITTIVAFIKVEKLQREVMVTLFAVKAQRKRSPCPIKRGTLKPSRRQATTPLTLQHSVCQMKAAQPVLISNCCIRKREV